MVPRIHPRQWSWWVVTPPSGRPCRLLWRPTPSCPPGSPAARPPCASHGPHDQRVPPLVGAHLSRGWRVVSLQLEGSPRGAGARHKRDGSGRPLGSPFRAKRDVKPKASPKRPRGDAPPPPTQWRSWSSVSVPPKLPSGA